MYKKTNVLHIFHHLRMFSRISLQRFDIYGGYRNLVARVVIAIRFRAGVKQNYICFHSSSRGKQLNTTCRTSKVYVFIHLHQLKFRRKKTKHTVELKSIFFNINLNGEYQTLGSDGYTK